MFFGARRFLCVKHYCVIKKSLLGKSKYGKIFLNPWRWVRGCDKPRLFGANASSNEDVSVFLHRHVPNIIWLGGRWCIYEDHGVNNSLIYQLPDRPFSGGLFSFAHVATAFPLWRGKSRHRLR